MTIDTAPSTITHSSGRPSADPPTLRFLHYNDVYHINVDDDTPDPVGGASRFVSLAHHYRSLPGPRLVTFFSGDAFNPSLESSITKGRHMVPILNEIGTDVACLGNHDLDFGVEQFKYLAARCNFPWLCGNVIDPVEEEEGARGIGGLKASWVTEVETEEGVVKVGVVGVVEKEWLDTINSLPPGLVYENAVECANREARKLRDEGCGIVVIVSHQREPNDLKLCEGLEEGLVDILLGGHDHYYAHQIVNGVHILRSGSDFQQLSYIEARRKLDGAKGWDFDIVRRDIVRAIPEDQHTKSTVAAVTSHLNAKLGIAIGYTAVPLDSVFTTVRTRESNYGNFVCDLMRFYYSADCTIMAGGTMRGNQIYPPGVIKLAHIIHCFPFEDPVVVARLSGGRIFEALENGVSKLPAEEGRFPQVSGIRFTFDASRPPGERIVDCEINGEKVDRNTEKLYTMATRGYMIKGKDGFKSLLGCEEIVDEENGVLISMILRQYFLSLKVLGKWSRAGPWRNFFGGYRGKCEANGELITPECVKVKIEVDGEDGKSSDEETESDWDEYEAQDGENGDGWEVRSYEEGIAMRVGGKWARLAGVKTSLEEVDWTRCVRPKVEGRIREITPGK